MYNKNRSWRSASDVPAMKCAYNKSGRMVANNYVTFTFDANGNTAYLNHLETQFERSMIDSITHHMNRAIKNMAIGVKEDIAK